MAALIPNARAARDEAARLRDETAGLKLVLRQSAAHSREQLRTAEAVMDRLQDRRDSPLPSPWSTLDWTYEGGALAGVLVPVV